MKSIFKLNKLHLFLIVIFVLLASSLGFSAFEYFQSEMQTENEALAEGDKYDPFGNSDNSNNDGYYDSIVGDLEDVIIPERRKRKHHHNSEGDHSQSCKCKNCKKNSNNNANNDTIADNANNANNFNPDPNKYMLKSEIVPPVCPKCPDSRTCPRQKPCPACPACARCPEPAFTCKKVPNYSVSTVGTNNILPMPQLNSFSAFN